MLYIGVHPDGSLVFALPTAGRMPVITTCPTWAEFFTFVANPQVGIGPLLRVPWAVFALPFELDLALVTAPRCWH